MPPFRHPFFRQSIRDFPDPYHIYPGLGHRDRLEEFMAMIRKHSCKAKCSREITVRLKEKFDRVISRICQSKSYFFLYKYLS